MSAWAWASLVIAVLLGVSGGTMMAFIQAGDPKFRVVTAIFGALLIFTMTMFVLQYNDNMARYACEEVTK